MAVIVDSLGPMGAETAVRITYLRTQKKVTLNWLSGQLRDLGRPIQLAALSKIENGQRRVDVDDLVAIALALDVSPLAILLPLDAAPSALISITTASRIDLGTQLQKWTRPAGFGSGLSLDPTRRVPGERTGRFANALGPTGIRAAACIAQIRAARGVTLGQLSAQLDKLGRPIQYTALSKIESGQRRVDVDDLVAIALALDVSPLAILLPLGAAPSTLVPITTARSIELATVLHNWRRPGLIEVNSAPALMRSNTKVIGIIPQMAECFQVRHVLAEMEATSGNDNSAVQCQILSGAGGVGKTQVAAHYAREQWASGALDLLVWLTAGNRESVVLEYARVASVLSISTAEDPEQSARDFLNWLTATDQTWLIVLDDLTDPGNLAGLWPPVQSSGRVIVTTRRRDAILTGTGRRRVDVDVFTMHEAAEYILAKLAVHERSDEINEAIALAQDLGFLPVALSQAVAYLLNTNLSCADYRLRWSDQHRSMSRLFPEEGALPDEQRSSIAAVLSLSIERANHLEPVGLAKPMLELIAMLDPNGIPISLLESRPALAYLAEHAASEAHNQGADLVSVEDARDTLSMLSRLGICSVNLQNQGRSVSVHSLLQRTIRERFEAKQFFITLKAAADALIEAWPAVENDISFGMALRGNAEKIVVNGQGNLGFPIIRRVVFRLGTSIGEAGMVFEAAKYFERLYRSSVDQAGVDIRTSLELRYEWARWRGEAGDAAGAANALQELLSDQLGILGANHLDTLATRNDLANSRGEAGDVIGAADAFQELLPDLMLVLGPDHPNTLEARNDLAYWRGEAGDAAGAADAFQELLPDLMLVLGPDHPDTLAARNNLAYWQGEAGDVAGAVDAFQVLLADQLRILGPDHPGTLVTRNHLAHWRGKAGDAAGAADAFQELLADQLRNLGPNHPDTLETRSNLARWRGEVGDAGGAADALQELLPDLIRVLGPDHPDTLETRNDLARWKGEAGDVLEAVQTLEELLPDLMRVLGPDHRNTLTTRNNLAFCRGEAGDVAGAVDAFQVLLADQLRILGPDHPGTLLTRSNLARWRGEAGDAAGAADAFQELLADQLRNLGPNHPDTLETRNNLARWKGEAGDVSGAVQALERLLPDLVRVFDIDHPNTLATRNNLAFWRGEAGDAAGAADAFQELLADQLRNLGPNHPDTLETRSNLARWRGEAGDAAGAAHAFQELVPDLIRVLGPEHPDTLSSRRDLARWRGMSDDPAGAIEALEDLLPVLMRVLGPNHPNTLVTRGNLARWRGEAGDASGAVDAFHELLADRLSILGPEHPSTLRTRLNLAVWRGKAGDLAQARQDIEELLLDLAEILGPNHPHALAAHEQLANLAIEPS